MGQLTNAKKVIIKDYKTKEILVDTSAASFSVDPYYETGISYTYRQPNALLGWNAQSDQLLRIILAITFYEFQDNLIDFENFIDIFRVEKNGDNKTLYYDPYEPKCECRFLSVFCYFEHRKCASIDGYYLLEIPVAKAGIWKAFDINDRSFINPIFTFTGIPKRKNRMFQLTKVNEIPKGE